MFCIDVALFKIFAEFAHLLSSFCALADKASAEYDGLRPAPQYTF
jgi:hypothetical protein